MKRDLVNELRRIRNELAHGKQSVEPAVISKRLSELGITLTPSEFKKLLPALEMNAFDLNMAANVPRLLTEAIAAILDGQTAPVVCDPWAGFGAILAVVREVTHAKRALAFTRNGSDASLGELFVDMAEWHVGNPFELLQSLNAGIDVVACVLPIGAKGDGPFVVPMATGGEIELHDDLPGLLLAASAMRLTEHGVGLYVVPTSFFFSQRSVLRHFDQLGLGIEAALALPLGAFATATKLQTYIAVVRKRPSSQMFVAQLLDDSQTNQQVFSNLKNGVKGGTLELGVFVDPLSFVGLDPLRAADRLEQGRKRFGAPVVCLGDLATAINMGRPDEGFEFPKSDNAVFVPLIGISDAVDMESDLTLKRQNYAQVTINPAMSEARFVTRFLNSELGKEIRELSKSRTVIPKLNRESVKKLRVLVPDLPAQKAMLAVETKIAAEQNTLRGLQNELDELRREIWADPRSIEGVEQRFRTLATRLSPTVKQHAAEHLEQWFETLPFPLASILRAWQATPSQDFEKKYGHLLHFFEATAEFVSVILLSAFSSSEEIFTPHLIKLTETLEKQKLSFRRATFGTWKIVVEYLAKQTRHLLLEGGRNLVMSRGTGLFVGKCSQI